MAHRHTVETSRTSCFSGPVSRDENPSAHGGITEHQTCSCGATRRININGGHVEKGHWVASEISSAPLTAKEREELRALWRIPHNPEELEWINDEEDDAREAAHQRQMDKWARAYDALNGAPENDEDR